MSNVITIIEDNIVEVAYALQNVPAKISQLQQIYAGFSGALTPLADNDPFTVNGKFTKDMCVKADYCLSQLNKFLGNQATAVFNNNKYLLNLQIGGDTAPVSILSQKAEYWAGEIKVLSGAIQQAFINANLALNMYFANNINGIVSALSGVSSEIPGGTVNASKLASGITLCEQLIKFCTEQQAATGDYKTTVLQWKR